MGHHVEAPTIWANRPEEHVRKIAQVLNGAMNGQTNNVQTATLRPDEVTTVVLASRARTNQVATIVPTNAAAAAEVNTTYAVVGNGSVTIHHESNANVRTVGVVRQG